VVPRQPLSVQVHSVVVLHGRLVGLVFSGVQQVGPNVPEGKRSKVLRVKQPILIHSFYIRQSYSIQGGVYLEEEGYVMLFLPAREESLRVDEVPLVALEHVCEQNRVGVPRRCRRLEDV
jgi:hypothetical protein